MKLRLISPTFILWCSIASAVTTLEERTLCQNIFENSLKCSRAELMLAGLLALSGCAEAPKPADPVTPPVSARALLDAPIEVGFCAGAPGSSYGQAGQYFKAALEGHAGHEAFAVHLYDPQTPDNTLNLLDQGVCQVGLLPRDAYTAYRRAPVIEGPKRLTRTEDVYDELSLVVCERSLGLLELADLADRTRKGEHIDIYVDNPSTAFTLETLKNTREDYVALSPVFVDSEGGGKGALLGRAIQNKACAAVRSRNTSDFSLAPDLAQAIVPLDMMDRRYLLDPTRQEPFYTYQKMTYQPRDHVEGPRDIYLLEIPMVLVSNASWEQAMEKKLENIQARESQNAWTTAIRELIDLDGNERPVAQEAPIQPAPVL